jgi:hypothetical protein
MTPEWGVKSLGDNASCAARSKHTGRKIKVNPPQPRHMNNPDVGARCSDFGSASGS